MSVRIVTDSSAGLPPGVAEELGITVIDLHVMSTDEGASTAGLSSLELCAAYARQLERGGDDGVVALHLSKELSSTWSSAVAAAAIFDDAVRVVDTGAVGMAVGAAAMAAARLAQDGAGLDECYALAVDILERSATWVYLHRLDELRRSGRISTATAVLSTALASKPIMRIEDGKIELAAKTRTQTKAFSRLVELVLEGAEGEPVFVAIQENEARESGRRLSEMLEEVLPEGSTVMMVELSDVLAVHAGPGSLGVSVVYSNHLRDLDLGL
ncbi:DegV domain-containing protein [Corynebacterium frankenforstense DSM 45800]|uniref:DegV domain-containing protein n=1 Tax=Corynebacterium frankenforstense DSM 45800 TaxID=1437875 RepID=A0A1L7CU60_9CORY|nr:DegV family protein [Corynebacterium frankenforstense]APT89361.1 DegV domain-containing protein [Corynebacterium frankenforstense DSM 45800]